MNKPELVSVHGGHSGQFCQHATDTLETIIEKYIELGFSWVGITEHTPAISEDLLDPGQRQQGITPQSLMQQFEEYFPECRRLRQEHGQQIEIFAAMEIETYSGYLEFVPMLITRFQPDYIVGSIHFVDDIIIDYSKELYMVAAKAAGSVTDLYVRYFDQQYEMIEKLNPAVVGHFDLVRIFDQDYQKRLQLPVIQQRIERNLALIKERELIMDLNLRALLKGAKEPYISRPILERAFELGIAVVPGDDSHGLSSVGAHVEDGIALLKEVGFSTTWAKPRLIQYG